TPAYFSCNGKDSQHAFIAGIRAGEAEIRDDDAKSVFVIIGRHQHDVGALDIAVDDSCFMRSRKLVRHLTNEGSGFVWGNRFSAVYAVRESFTAQKFHAQEGDL